MKCLWKHFPHLVLLQQPLHQWHHALRQLPCLEDEEACRVTRQEPQLEGSENDLISTGLMILYMNDFITLYDNKAIQLSRIYF